MAGMKAERDGFAAWLAEAALGAEDQESFAAQFVGIPAHAGVLTEAEDISAGLVEEHFRREGQFSRRPFGFSLDIENLFRAWGEQIASGHWFIFRYGMRQRQGDSKGLGIVRAGHLAMLVGLDSGSGQTLAKKGLLSPTLSSRGGEGDVLRRCRVL